MKKTIAAALIALSAVSAAKAGSDVLPLSGNSVMIMAQRVRGTGILGMVQGAIEGSVSSEVMTTAARETLARGFRYFTIVNASGARIYDASTMNVIVKMSNKPDGFDAAAIANQ